MIYDALIEVKTTHTEIFTLDAAVFTQQLNCQFRADRRSSGTYPQLTQITSLN
jgi:hypothetical protein